MRRASALGDAMAASIFWVEGSPRFEVTYVIAKIQPLKLKLDGKNVTEYSDSSPDLLLGHRDNP